MERRPLRLSKNTPFRQAKAAKISGGFKIMFQLTGWIGLIIVMPTIMILSRVFIIIIGLIKESIKKLMEVVR